MITIVDFGTGNLGSIANMFTKVGVQSRISGDPAVIDDSERIVLPGVGSFDNGMQHLEERGLRDVLDRKARVERVPILGVCLGMQLLTKGSEEGRMEGLGWIDAKTVRFDFTDTAQRLRTPHMGWNTLERVAVHPLMQDLGPGAKFYFVHSYHVTCASDDNVLAGTTYGYSFTSALKAENIMGVQFHPEKSHRFGMQLFRNFARIPAAALLSDAITTPVRHA